MNTVPAQARRHWLPAAPASFFAMTLGLAETGNAWRNASSVWQLNPMIGEVLEALAVISFIWWLAVYANKWLQHRAAAVAEWRDPVQASFVALLPESVILVALALRPHWAEPATVLFWIGSVANLVYGAYRLSAFWTQPREAGQVTPSLYLTYSASVLVNALAAGLFGYTDYGFALFGVGGISWLVMDSVITQQLAVGGLAAKTRNFMGIYMAPPVIALVAYQVLAGDTANVAVIYALMGYALFVTVGMVFSWRWLREQAFAPGYWAYTFGIATLAQGLLTFAERHPSPLLAALAGLALAATSVTVLAVVVGSVKLVLRGAYFPQVVVATPAV